MKKVKFLIISLTLLIAAYSANAQQNIKYVDFHYSEGYLICDLAPKGYEMADFSEHMWKNVKNNVKWYKEFLPHFLPMVYADIGIKCPYKLDEDFKIRIDGKELGEDETIAIKKARDYHDIFFTREHIDEVFRPINSPGKEFFSYVQGYGVTSLQNLLYFNDYWNELLPGWGRYALPIEERQEIIKDGKIIWKNPSTEQPREIKDDYNFPFGFHLYWGSKYYGIYVRYTKKYIKKNEQKTKYRNNVFECESIANEDRVNDDIGWWNWPTLESAEKYAIRLTKKKHNIEEAIIVKTFVSYDKYS